MKIAIFAAALLCIALAATTSAAPAGTRLMPDANSRGMWVWGQWPAPLSDPTKADAFFKQLVSPFGVPQWKINRIYMEFGRSNLISDAARIRQFIAKAHSYGIAVENLDGNAEWTYTAQKSIPKAICDENVKFNAGATSADQRLDGLHFDIEPHTLGDIWRQNVAGGKDNYNNELEANYMEIMRYCRNVFDTKDGALTIAGDVGADYSQYVTDLWAELMKGDSVHYLGLMNYFDTTARFINGDVNEGGGLLPNLKLTTKVPLVFGAESIQETSAPPANSFWQEGYYPMESTMLAAKRAASSNPLFRGVAIHHYLSYFALKAGVNKGDSIDTSSSGGGVTTTSSSTATKPSTTSSSTTGTKPSTTSSSTSKPTSPATPPPNTGALKCTRSGTTTTVTGLGTNVKCVMRTDTYAAAKPSSGKVSFNAARNVKEVELYTKYVSANDCAGWIGNVSC